MHNFELYHLIANVLKDSFGKNAGWIRGSAQHNARLRRLISGELLFETHPRRALGTTDVFETPINFFGISVYVPASTGCPKFFHNPY